MWGAPVDAQHMATIITAKFFSITHNRSRLSLSLKPEKVHGGWNGGVWSRPAAPPVQEVVEPSCGLYCPLVGHEWRCWLWVPPAYLAVPLSQGLLSPFCPLLPARALYCSFNSKDTDCHWGAPCPH